MARQADRPSRRLADRLAGAGGPDIVDVWSRTQPKYRRRAIVLLLTNITLFAGLNVFAFWLHYGKAFDFRWGSYTFALVRTSLLDFVQYPISVQQVPLMVVILGLTLGVMIAVPIVVAQLYRFPTSLLFVAQVCFLAHLPILAGFLLLGCYIAGGQRLRLSFRFASTVLGLIPIVIYLLMATKGVDLNAEATRVGLFATVLITVLLVGVATLIAHQARMPLVGGTLGLIVALGLLPVTVWVVIVPQQQALLIDPAQSLLYYAPWLLAVVSACLLSAMVLLHAWMVSYRPGAIAPSLAILLAIPVVLFETKVGRDELYYRVLEAQYGPRSRSFFRQHDLKPMIFELARREWVKKGKRDLPAIMENIKLAWELELDPIGGLKDDVDNREQTALAEDQYTITKACDAFLGGSYSRYIPNVLYIKGRAMDMRVDLRRFRREGVLTYYDDFVSRSSRQTWATLLENYPRSPLSSVARYKMAVLDARGGRIDEAIALLEDLAANFGTAAPEPPHGRTGFLAQVFARKPAASSLDVDVATVVEQASELLAMLAANGRDAIFGAEPVAELLKVDSRSPWYADQLKRLFEEYRRSVLADNLQLRLAMKAESLTRRIGLLQDVIREHTGGDAVPEAMYQLGRLLEADARPEEAKQMYTDLATQYANTVWALRAGRRVHQLEPQPTLR